MRFIGDSAADTIDIDLATLERVLKHGLDLGSHALQGCVLEVSISPEILAALTKKVGGVDCVLRPSEFGVTPLAAK
jgi:hypothetical protein